MESLNAIELLGYTIPTLVTGGIAYYFFNLHIKNEDNRRRFLLLKENRKDALPLKLQAYERMALFLERINPSKLLIRVVPFNDDKNDYQSILIHAIEQEFEHNLAQQIYISEECWTVINTAKSSTIQIIRRTNNSEHIDSANKLREAILSDLLSNQSPSSIAMSFLKNEISDILQ